MSLKAHWLVLRGGAFMVAVAGGALPAAAQQTAAALRPHAAQWEQLLAAEDARARTPAQLTVILASTRSAEPELRRLAVRALGRLERSALADSLVPFLRDPSARVRVEAAHAIGQAMSREPGIRMRDPLSSALAAERDSLVRGAIAETLGRLRYANLTEARGTLDLLVPHLMAPTPVALGAVRGVFYLARQPSARPAFDAAARSALLRLATNYVGAVDAAERARIVATATLAATGGLDEGAIRTLLYDRNAFVRREAVAGLQQLTDTAKVAPLIKRVLSDEAAFVRYEGLRVYARRLARDRGCGPIADAATADVANNALLAIDLLGSTCTSPETLGQLDALARRVPPRADGEWHTPARALVALAIRSPERARGRLNSFAGHRSFYVRTYAAIAADTLHDTALLMRLSRDAHPNVRTAAVEGLRRALGHAADSIYIAQLSQDDSQLLQAAAAALDSTAHPGAASALLGALDRVTRAQRETSRDARNALLVRIRQLGNSGLADRVRPYLRDFDPQIATRAAETLQAWTGSRVEPEPTAPPAVALPTFAQTEALSRGRAVIQVFEGEVVIQLMPFDAPTNAARFARMARAGDFDELTFHRIAPNFVVQGGSPNANEYTGDGPFTRDELGAENWRGTVGISTRGRDTGDGQLYINLIDNVRLDHDYTVIGRIISGMEFFDTMLEGAVIRKVVIR